MALWLNIVFTASLAAMVTGVILVARANVFRDLHLRELPHAALERLQHPVAAYEAGARRDTPPNEALGELGPGVPANGQFTDGQPADGRPADGQPADGQPDADDSENSLVPRDPLTSG